MRTVSAAAKSASRAPASGRVHRNTGIAAADMPTACATWATVRPVAASVPRRARPDEQRVKEAVEGDRLADDGQAVAVDE